MRTKIFSLFLAVVASIGIANAASIYENIDGINYELNDANMKAFVRSHTDKYSGDIVIPAAVRYNDQYYTVTAIDYNAFADCNNMTSISLPNTITLIGSSAFSGCTSLVSFTIPNSVETIGSSAFFGCSGLVSITIGTGVRAIGSSAFYGCEGLSAVYIFDIAAWCAIDFYEYFATNPAYYCSNPLYYANNLYLNGELVTDLVIPNGIEIIDNNAFNNTTCLKSVTIPATVKEIGSFAFSKCTGLEAVYITDLAAWCDINFKSFNGSHGNPLSSAHNLYLNGQLVTDLVIPEGVDSIKLNAFSDLQCITSLSISKSVKYINGDAFSRCTNLLTILYNAKRCEDLPNGQIGFRDGGSYVPPISSVIFGNEVERIPASLFRDLSNITELVIPSNVKEIGELGFYGCSGLQKVTFENGIEKIGNYSFYQCSKIDSIVIPNSVTQIGMYAFYGCSSVKYASISNQLINIREYTFSGCRSLEGIVIPASVETIGQHAFDGCRSMQYVTCEAINPPVCGTQTFNYVDKSIPLYVPAASMETYAQADQWRDFSDIRPIGDIYRVSFVDFDGTEIKSEYVDGGQTAMAPEDPMREGYTFIGWDTDFSNVSEYLTVTAQYAINRFVVKFLNWDNSVLKTDSIDWHGSAVAPANPIREGYTFTSWDKTFDDITADLTVRAQFTINYYDVFFLNYDGQVLKEQSVQYNTSATAPNAPAREGYSFIGWSGEYSNVASRLFIVAQYEKEQTGAIPVRFVDVEGETLLISYVLDTAPIAPVIVDRTFLGWQTIAAGIEDGIVIQATYEDDSHTAAPSIQMTTDSPQKVVRDGNVYILRGNQTYTLTGSEVR